MKALASPESQLLGSQRGWGGGGGGGVPIIPSLSFPDLYRPQIG